MKERTDADLGYEPPKARLTEDDFLLSLSFSDETSEDSFMVKTASTASLRDRINGAKSSDPKSATPHRSMSSIQHPLPNEMPDFERQPSISANSEGFSQTVSTLVSQNDDLMNRLGVILKRNGELERRLQNYQEINNQLQNENEALRDEFDLFEKRFEKADQEVQRASRLQAEAESRFGEYYANTQFKLEDYNTETNQLKKTLYRLINFHRRVMTYGKTHILNLKETISRLSQDNKELNLERMATLSLNNTLKDELLMLQQRYLELEHQSETDRRNLVENYEGRLQSISSLHETSINQLSYFKNRIKSLESEIQTVVELHATAENRAILEERKRRETENRLTLEIEKLRAEIFEVRSQSNALDIQRRDLINQVEVDTQRFNELKEESAHLKDRNEGLQIVWQETSRTIEEMRKKESSFEKLNSELSRQLKLQRDESHRLQDEIQKRDRANEDDRRRMASLATLPKNSI